MDAALPARCEKRALAGTGQRPWTWEPDYQTSLPELKFAGVKDIASANEVAAAAARLTSGFERVQFLIEFLVDTVKRVEG